MRFRESLFWDTDPANINVKKNAAYVIERILELGNDKEVKWLWNNYQHSLIKKIILTSRSITPKTKNLWQLLLKNQ